MTLEHSELVSNKQSRGRPVPEDGEKPFNQRSETHFHGVINEALTPP